MSFSKQSLNGAPLTRESFKTPPREMGILPFWFWNGDLDEKELEWQLREYHSKGIPGIFIHGRFGLKVPYVSDRWFEKVKFAVRKAKEIGIDAWVYDEMNWPSGTAERQVLKKYPHLTQKYLELVALNVDGPLFTFLEATDDRYVNTGDSHPIAAFGCTEDEFQTGIRNAIDLTQNLSFNKVLPWEAPEGKWRLLYFLEKEVPYYIDALNPESTRRFIEITHERYKQAVGKEFGSVVPGFFTDEPAMHYYHVGIDNYVVPWSSRMFKIFRERRGYDLRPFLPALYTSMGEHTARVRYDFWRTLTEQYSDAYYKQLRDWCDANGVIFTGHLLFEEWLRMHARCEGNIFKHLKHMHMTGVDHLYPKIGTEQEPDQHVALKIASSAAHHFGSKRLICESMGGTYWDCTLERMKRMLHWEYVLGVNLFNNHGYHYSIEGERKRDWPPSQFYHHTWWKHYDRFTSYATRLSHLLSGGRHVAKVLVLYPLTSIWANYIPQRRTEVGNVIEFDFNYLTDALLRLHYDYDYVDEDVLCDATVKNGRIHIADEKYEVLILPPITHLKRKTFEVLKRFVAAGGKVIADTLLPVEFLETPKNGAMTEVRKLFGIDPAKRLAEFTSGNAAFRLVKNGKKGKTFTFLGKGLHTARSRRQELGRVLAQCITPDVTISDGEVFYLHRVKDNHDVYFLVNTSKSEKRNVEVTFERVGQPELWNPNTGESNPLPMFEIFKGRLKIFFDFPPSESHVIVLGNEIPKSHITMSSMSILSFDGKTVRGSGQKPLAKIATPRGVRTLRGKEKRALKPIALNGLMSFATDRHNVLCLGSWKMKIEGRQDRNPAGTDVNDSDWLAVTNGAWETQLPQERDHATYPAALWYRTSFEIADIPRALRIMIDGFSGKEHRLFVNVMEVKDKGTRSYLDAEIREVDIHRFARTGRNVIAVRLVVQRRTDGILDLLKILGPFALRNAGNEYVISAPPAGINVGDWTKQGYPHFSGTGVYKTEFTLPDQYCSGRLFFEADCGEDVLEISVNDLPLRVAPWHPYRIEITDAARPGANTLEIRVTNTLINILEAVGKPSGLMSPPRIVHEHVHELTL
ncbi:MAG: hypothetical protein HYW57_07090 [Ignavibacteriales bacterium]|nr:hypothetical protein [Ignavibacteriales bacterium]